MREYERHHLPGNMEGLSFTSGPFSGIIWVYGGVSLIEDKQADTLKIAFDYQIFEYPEDCILDEDEFKQEISEHLADLIVAGAKENELIFRGGI